MEYVKKKRVAVIVVSVSLIMQAFPNGLVLADDKLEYEEDSGVITMPELVDSELLQDTEQVVFQ